MNCIPVVTPDATKVFLNSGGDGVYGDKSTVEAQSNEHEEEEEGPELGDAGELEGHGVGDECQFWTFP